MQVMMLAAGEGTRLRPYTLKKPKPAMPMLNVPLAAYGLHHFRENSISKLGVNTYHLPHLITQLFQQMPSKLKEPIWKNLQFSHETGQILGSGGGLGGFRNYFSKNEPIILMNSDEIILAQEKDFIDRALEQHKRLKAISTLIVTENPEVGTKFGGVWAESDGLVRGFGKVAIEHTTGHHFVGIQILSPEIFNFIPEGKENNILYDAVTTAMTQGHPAYIYPIQTKWFETGNPTDYLAAQQELLTILAGGNHGCAEYQFLKTLMTRFGHISATDWLHMQEGLRHKNLIHPTATIEEGIVLGDGNCIGEKSELKINNSAVGPSGATLQNCVIDSELQIQISGNESEKIWI